MENKGNECQTERQRTKSAQPLKTKSVYKKTPTQIATVFVAPEDDTRRGDRGGGATGDLPVKKARGDRLMANGSMD